MDVTANLVAVMLLIVVNGFFVAAEFALVKQRSCDVADPGTREGPSFGLKLRTQAALEGYLAACRLGIAMASLGIGWAGGTLITAALESIFEPAGIPNDALLTSAFILGFLILCSFYVVLGEDVPRALAIHRPARVARSLSYPIRLVYLVSRPLNLLLSWFSSRLVVFLGVDQGGEDAELGIGGIDDFVDSSVERGEIQEDVAEMLAGRLAHDQRQVERVMTPIDQTRVLDVAKHPADNLVEIYDRLFGCRFFYEARG
jgi:CBS domain containing-hemolysin-like protein